MRLGRGGGRIWGVPRREIARESGGPCSRWWHQRGGYRCCANFRHFLRLLSSLAYFLLSPVSCELRREPRSGRRLVLQRLVGRRDFLCNETKRIISDAVGDEQIIIVGLGLLALKCFMRWMCRFLWDENAIKESDESLSLVLSILNMIG